MNDELFSMAKRRAAETGTSFTAIVEAGVRSILMPSGVSPDTRPLPILPTFKGSGLQPGADIEDGKALRDIMDGIQ